MRLKWILGIILIFSLISVGSASVIEVHQRDTIYLGEIVDISRVMSWSGQFAYFTNNEPGDYPAIIIDVNDVGHMYNYYIDPAKYCVGTWYKWDGKDESSANMVAFYIASGVRNNTYISSLNTTVTKKPEVYQNTTMPAKIYKDTHLLLARGDVGTLKYTLTANNLEHPEAYLWLFGTIPNYDLTKGSLMTEGTLMGIKMNYTSGDSINSFTFSPELSNTLQEGWYSGYIQFVGLNGRQDVYYVPNHKIEGYHYAILETPYDDDIIPDIPLEGLLPYNIEQQFLKLENDNKYSDDSIIPISIEVVTPSLNIEDYWEEADNIIIRGSTSLSAGTLISVMIDPEQYVTLPEIRANTHRTFAEYKDTDNREGDCTTTVTNLNNDGFNVSTYNGTVYNITYANGTSLKGIHLENNQYSKTKCTSVPRTFSISVPLKWDNMAIGSHTIQATIDTYGIKKTAVKDFVVSGSWVNPTPTQEFNKLIVVKGGESHLVNISTGQNLNSTDPLLAPYTSTPSITVVPTEEIIYVGNHNITTPQTPIPVTIPVQKPQTDYNWLLYLIAILALGALVVYWAYNG